MTVSQEGALHATCAFLSVKMYYCPYQKAASVLSALGHCQVWLYL